MNETLALASAAAGILLGMIFYGGLWWTVRRGVSSNKPALWFVGGLLLRTSITMAGFYFVARGHWERFLLCLLGFLIGGFLITWFTRAPQKPTYAEPEANHAP